MKARAFSVAVAVVMWVSLSTPFLSCGDKFFVPIRGTRSQRPGLPRQSAAILIYDSGSELHKGLKGGSAFEILKKAGFQPTSAGTRSDFDRELNRGGWDAVLVSLEDAQALSERLGALADRPAVVPVTLNASDATVQQARKTYPVVLRVPAKDNAFLSAIDKAVEQRSKSRKALSK
jgi:hypothetical protein